MSKLPPATLPEAEKLLALLIQRGEELREQAALMFMAIAEGQRYLERALEAVRATGDDDD